MAYIGRGTDKISNIEKLDTITFDGSSSYTLQKNSVNFTPNSANSLQVSIDGVVQAGNFTVSGSTIDFGVAIPSTSTNDFIFHYGTGLITTPADGTVGLAQLSATGTKDATTFLRGDNTFASAGGDNTPAFSAFLSIDQALSAATQKIICNNEIFDTDSAYNTSTGEFTVPTGEGGKYFINANVAIDVTTQLANYIYVNGSREAMGQRVIAGNARGLGVSCILNLSAGDVVTYYIYVAASGNADASELGTYFQGYKLIGV